MKDGFSEMLVKVAPRVISPLWVKLSLVVVCPVGERVIPTGVGKARIAHRFSGGRSPVVSFSNLFEGTGA